MALLRKYAPYQNLTNFSTFIRDTDPNSKYFRISQFQETFTGGKNGFLIEGTEFLKETTDVRIELLDVNGNPIYFEPAKGEPAYYEGISKLISVYVYDETPIGIGKITILGELKNYQDGNGAIVPVPDEWKGVYNVKWERTFYVNKILSNTTPVRFAKRPTIDIEEISKSIFDKTIPTVTQTGSVQGIPQLPDSGSDLTKWTKGTTYKLKITDGGNWTGSIVDNIITIPDLNYAPTVIEVLNSKEILVKAPYTSSNLVAAFSATGYTSSFQHLEGEVITNSNLTGSFAKIKINNLETHTGDVARVKVFRKSVNEVGDYQFVQEYLLESNELLLDVDTATNTQTSYGDFDQTKLDTYWVTSSTNHPVSIDYDTLYASVKIDYNNDSGSVQKLYTSESFAFNENFQYTLSFKTLLSGSKDSTKKIHAYLSSSNFTQSIITVSGSDIYKTRVNIEQNIISENSGSAQLVFDINGDDWYISQVSLQAASEVSFSPDEFTLIQAVPRNLTTETFDFKFEFYDVDNNFIPVEVDSTKQFSQGNTSTQGIQGSVTSGSAGLVLRGEWSQSTNYAYGGPDARRDVVMWSADGDEASPRTTYWIASSTHTATNDTSTSTGRPFYGPWTVLGTGSFFVASEIGIFKDSFIKSTLNIGTNASGSAANITLYGSSSYPYISLGQTTQSYASTGIWLGNDTGSYRMSLVGSTGFMKWSGNTLMISGTITGSDIRGGLLSGAVVNAGQIVGSTITGTTIVGSTINVPTTGTGSQFSVDIEGNLIAQSVNISGSLDISEGTIGNWEIENRDDGGRLKSLQSITSRSVILDPLIPEISLVLSGSDSIRISPVNELSDPMGQDINVNDMVTSSVSLTSATSSTTSQFPLSVPYQSQSFSGTWTIPQDGTYVISDLAIPYTMQLNEPTVVANSISTPSGYTDPYDGQIHGTNNGSSAKNHYITSYLIISSSKPLQYVPINTVTYTSATTNADYYIYSVDEVGWVQTPSDTPSTNASTTGYTTTIQYVTPSVYLYEGEHRFAYGFKVSAASGKTINTNPFGTNTTTYTPTTSSATVSFTNGKNGEFNIPVAQELLEITSKGIQIVSDSSNQRLVKFEKFDSATMGANEILASVQGGLTSLMSSSMGDAEVTGSLRYPAVGWRVGRNGSAINLTTAGTFYNLVVQTADTNHYAQGVTVTNGSDSITILQDGFYLVGVSGLFGGKNDNDELHMRIRVSTTPILTHVQKVETSTGQGFSATTAIYLNSGSVLNAGFMNNSSNTDTVSGGSDDTYFFGTYLGK